MRSRFLLIATMAVFLLAISLGLASQRQERQRRTDLSPIALPGGSRVEFHDMDSAALKGRGQYSIFLPPSYGKNPSRSFPVVYFLHGLYNDHTTWTLSRNGDLPAILERLMLDGKVSELIMVHPDGDQSFYMNYRDGSMKYEDFVVEELPHHIEANYRSRTGRGNRAISGTSMGGYGALKIAFRFPERYIAVAAHSPIVFPVSNPLDVPPEQRAGRRFEFFASIFSTVYGSDQAYYDANNPLTLARDHPPDGLAVYFDYGTADRYDGIMGLGEGLSALDRALTAAGVSHTFRAHAGEGHGWSLVQAHIEESLGFLAERF